MTAIVGSRPREPGEVVAGIGPGSPGPLPGANRRLRVVLVTEGTYPYVIGGVSTWCDQLMTSLSDIDWLVVPIVAGGLRRSPLYRLPENARLAGVIDLWGPGRSRSSLIRANLRRTDLPARLAKLLLGWESDPSELTDELVWCHRHPAAVLPSFRSHAAWRPFLAALAEAVDEPNPSVTPGLGVDMATAVTCYQTLSWVARAATTTLPSCDVLHVTAAGWAGVPALVCKRETGTPLLLTEHGVFVREAYLAAVRSGESAASRLISTRLARSFARACYRAADMVAPVTQAHSAWEAALGVPPERVCPIPNGVAVGGVVTPPPRAKVVVTVGRIDPLKDVKTLLRVAARVLERHPDATFLHYGPVPPGQDSYGEACSRLHSQLGLGERFVFKGPTSDPHAAIRGGDVALMTSISEGFPMAILEALSEARPVVTTQVGGVLDAMTGAGLTAAPRDVEALAEAVCALLEDPGLAEVLGRRGRARVLRRFDQAIFVDRYREALWRLAAPGVRRLHG